MKIFISILFFSIARATFVTKCEIDARDAASRQTKKCKSIATRKIEGRNSETVRNFRKNIQKFEGKKSKAQKKLCEKAQRLYEPNGLITEIPPTWSCSRDETMQAVLNKLSKQQLNVDQSGEAINIVLVGRTGAGKSYFGNALLGSLEPGRKDRVPFPAKESQASHTQNIYAQTGTLFGGYYDKELGLSEPLKVNVFDTPGFADSDPENIKKNKLLIASAIKNDIHMIIFLTSNARFDAGNQDALEMLNEWTAGKMWNNILIVKGRFSFDERSVNDRFNQKLTMFELKQNAKIVDFLTKRSAERTWTEKSVVQNKVVSRPLDEADFAKIKISLLNMAQHRECYNDKRHQRSEKCWNLPSFDNYDQYETDYDSSDYQEVVATEAEKYAFIEEAKLFTNMLKEMKKNPVKPASQIFKFELDQDNELWQAILQEELEIDGLL